MNFIIKFSFLLFLCSCDCIQQAIITVVDTDTKLPISDVMIYENKIDSTNYSNKTNSYGVYRIDRMNGGLLGCPNINLFFVKEGYISKNEKFKSYNKNPVIVKLKKIEITKD